MSNGNRIPGRPPINGRFTGVMDAKLRADNPLYAKTRPITPQFEKERCEFNARQMADLQKTEAQRRFENLRREQMQKNEHTHGRGSQMIRQDRPQPQLKPRPALASGVDRSAFVRKEARERVAAAHAATEKRESITANSIKPLSKEAFKAARSAHTQSQSRTRDR